VEKDINERGSFFRFLIKEVKFRGHSNAEDVRKAEFDYEWHKLGFFTDWLASGKLVALCFGLPDELKDSIMRSLRKSDTEMALKNPFALHAFLVEEIVALFDSALWHCRHLVRHVEKA
jgi:hypothetical protein